MAIAELSIVPVGTGGPSVSDYVALAIKALDEMGIKYELTGMGTIVEGELDEVLLAVRAAHERVLLAPGVQRVVTSVRIDDRRDRPATGKQKVESVRSKLRP